MRRLKLLALLLVGLLTACSQESSSTPPSTSRVPSTSSVVVTTVTRPVVTPPLSVPTPTVNPGLTSTVFPADFSQAAAAYNSTGAVPPQGGMGNVLRYPTGATLLDSMPAISRDGRLVVLSAGNKGLLALRLDQDFNKVSQAWHYTPPEAAAKDGFVQTPMLYNDLVIVSDASGNLHCVNLLNGNLVWINRDPLRLFIGDTITDGLNLYFTARTDEDPTMFGPSGGYLYAIKLSDGSLVWKSPKIPGAGGKIIFGWDTNLYFGAWDTQIEAYTRRGLPVAGWPNPKVGTVASGPQAVTDFSFANDRIYVGNGGVFALDRAGQQTDAVGNAGLGTYYAPAIVGDTVYAGTIFSQPPINSPMFEVKAFNAVRLKEEGFTFHTDFPGVASLTVVDGYIYFGAAERFFQVKGDGSGQNRQMFLAGASFSYGNTPVVSNGRVYVTNPDGNLYIVK